MSYRDDFALAKMIGNLTTKKEGPSTLVVKLKDGHAASYDFARESRKCTIIYSAENGKTYSKKTQRSFKRISEDELDTVREELVARRGNPCPSK